MRIRAVVTVILLLLSVYTHAEIYKWVDENGKVHFTDNKLEADAKNMETVELKINTYTHVTFDAAPTISNNVVMYSTSWCGYCKQARQYFRKNNIAFTEYDIEKSRSAKKQYNKLGGNGVPVILYKEKRMNGFSEKAFQQLYKPKT